jgi:hypothetical protein
MFLHAVSNLFSQQHMEIKKTKIIEQMDHSTTPLKNKK